MTAVFKKEFSQLFRSMIGYVCLAVFAVITGYYFLTMNLMKASADIRSYFSSVATVMMLILPSLFLYQPIIIAAPNPQDKSVHRIRIIS